MSPTLIVQNVCGIDIIFYRFHTHFERSAWGSCYRSVRKSKNNFHNLSRFCRTERNVLQSRPAGVRVKLRKPFARPHSLSTEHEFHGLSSRDGDGSAEA